ncbi:hypothetical protein LXL04_027607 [Taraxacum kok-saghyz]
MYSFKVEPIKGRSMWPKSDCPITLLPPPHHNTPGRPKKKRKITADEKSQRKKEKSQELLVGKDNNALTWRACATLNVENQTSVSLRDQFH